MFGTKQAKRERQRAIFLLLQSEGSMTASEIAERLRVPRSTIYRDLPDLDARNIQLDEDAAGRLSISRWNRVRP